MPSQSFQNGQTLGQLFEPLYGKGVGKVCMGKVCIGNRCMGNKCTGNGCMRKGYDEGVGNNATVLIPAEITISGFSNV